MDLKKLVILFLIVVGVIFFACLIYLVPNHQALDINLIQEYAQKPRAILDSKMRLVAVINSETSSDAEICTQITQLLKQDSRVDEIAIAITEERKQKMIYENRALWEQIVLIAVIHPTSMNITSIDREKEMLYQLRTAALREKRANVILIFPNRFSLLSLALVSSDSLKDAMKQGRDNNGNDDFSVYYLDNPQHLKFITHDN